MVRRWMLLIMMLFPLIGCHSLSVLQDQTQQTIIPVKIERLFYTPEDFSRIKVSGQIILNIHTGARRSWVSMHGDSRDLRNIEWKVASKTKILSICLGHSYPKHGPVTIDIGVRQLNALSYHGNGNVTGHRLHSYQLDLDIHNARNTLTLLEGNMNLHKVALSGEGAIQIKGGANHLMSLRLQDKVNATITGPAAPQKITMSDCSYLTIRQIQAKDIQIAMTDKACAILAGKARWALIKLEDSAHFNGRYLRLTEAFVKTSDKAMALIYVINSQHTLATGKSNIYYYNTPSYRFDNMEQNAAVLNYGNEVLQEY